MNKNLLKIFSILFLIFVFSNCSNNPELNPNIDKNSSFIELGNVLSYKYLDKNLISDLSQTTPKDPQFLSEAQNQNEFNVDTANLSSSTLTNSENKEKYMKLLNGVYSYLNSSEFDNNLYDRMNKAKNLINSAKDSLELQKALIEVQKSQQPMEEAIMKMMVKVGFKDQKEVQALSILLRDDKDVVAFNQKFEIMFKNKMEKFSTRFNELQTLLLQKIQEFRKKN